MRKPAIILGTGAALVLLSAFALSAGRLGLVCLGEGAGGPDTTSAGPVTLATDRAVYAPSDAITITITNHLDRTIYFDSANCSHVALDKQEASGWSSVPVCHPYAGEAPPPVIHSDPLVAGSFFSDKIDELVLDGPLTSGTYRLRVAYYFTPVAPNYPGFAPPTRGRVPIEVVTSATIRVCTCRSC